ncbi:MAG TPA: hypothetical protein PKC18_10620 [Lacipirellulaceae bacterium]|nr:hypothetical protein [Lacipirellulaceae bacterium]
MFAPNVEELKRQYTDKFVKVDASRPELARFGDVVGQVKTVNMSGRALVEFQDYHLNIGWFDIDLASLTVVDKPEAKSADAKQAPARKPAAKAAAAKAPAAEGKKLSPLEMAQARGAAGAGKPAAAKPAAKPAGGKPSTADILAAARAGKGTPAAKAETPAAPAKQPAAPAPAPAAESGGPAKAMDKSKMSVAEMLAAARAGKSAAPAAAAAPAEPPAAQPPARPAEEAAAPAPPAGKPGRVDKSTMTVEQMIAYCREHDGG